jgi:hypothetical protein
MQTQTGRHRYRGWRESKTLVQLAKGAAADFKTLATDQRSNESDFDALETKMDTLTETYASQIQHLRTQMRYRMTHRS